MRKAPKQPDNSSPTLRLYRQLWRNVESAHRCRPNIFNCYLGSTSWPALHGTLKCSPATFCVSPFLVACPRLFLYPRTRVPHISPGFGEMWEITDAGARVPVLPENFRSESSQFPQLAKTGDPLSACPSTRPLTSGPL